MYSFVADNAHVACRDMK